MFLVHAGNRIDAPDTAQPRFAPSNERVVAERLCRLLDLLEPDGVVTAAAAGADLLLIEAAEAKGVPVHLVLPCERRRFRGLSVEDRGERWGLAFDHAAELVLHDERNSLIELDLEPDDDAFRAANQALLDRAAELGSDAVLAVAVRPRGGEEPPSVTDDFVRRAEEQGLLFIEIDPRT